MTVFNLTNRNDILAYEFETELDGADYRFEFNYNRCDEAWYFNILDAEGCYIRTGVKSTVNIDVLRGWVAEGRPLGELFFADIEETRSAAGERDLGDKVFFTYNGVNE